jgi:broad specificity phosphatase PhoE
MFKNETTLEKSLLREFRPGMQRDLVETKIRNKYPDRYPWWKENQWRYEKNTIGPIVICEYLTSIATSKGYTSEWIFDERGKLLKIDVRVFADGP